MAAIIATAATSSLIGTRLTGLQTNSARFGFGTKRATKKAGPGSDRRMLCPGVKALEWLDGSLVGDYGFDPCGLGKPAEYLQQLEVLGSLDQNVAMNLVGEVVGTTTDVTDVTWTILAALGALAVGWLAGAVSQSKSKPLRPQFVLFGSSIVQFSYYEGWGSLLAHFYARQADIVLRGYSGWNSRRAVQILDKVFPKNAASQPSLVIVYFGGNDSTISNPNGIGPHVPLEEYVENMRKIAIHVQSLSEKTRLLVLSNPPINEAQIVDNSDAWGRPLKTNEACRIYSEACLELCREMNIKAIDLWTLIQKREDWREVSFVDGVHLTYEASKTVAKEILKVIREADWKPSLHYQSMPIEFSEDSPYDPVGSDGNSTANTVLRGYAAWNSRRAMQVLDKVFPKVHPVLPALVVVHFGSEDSTRPHSSGLGPHVPLQEYIGNMRKIAEYLKALSCDTRLIFLSTPPVNEEKIPVDSDGKKPRTNEPSKQYLDACLNICRDLDIVAIDLFSAIQKKDNWQDVCFIDDGVNLSAEGNIVVYEEILAALKRQEAWAPSVYWTMMLSEFREDSIYDPVNPDGVTQSNLSNYTFPDPAKWGEPDYGVGKVTTQSM